MHRRKTWTRDATKVGVRRSVVRDWRGDGKVGEILEASINGVKRGCARRKQEVQEKSQEGMKIDEEPVLASAC